MERIQTNISTPISVAKDQTLQLIDIFDKPGQKTIELESHSSFTYLILCTGADIDIQVVTKGSECSCKIFGLFASDAKHPVAGSITVSLKHVQTSAEVELVSFLYDGAKASIDGSIDIAEHLEQVHGRLLEQNIVLGKNISVKTLPKLNIASHDVRASHGATIDTLDQQKLFYMMSRGLSQQQSQELLVNGYIDYVLSHFQDISDEEKSSIYKKLV